MPSLILLFFFLILQVDPFDLYSAFFGGGSDGFFGDMGDSGGMGFDFMNKRSLDLDIR